MLKQIFLTILLVCFNLRCSSSERTPNGDYYNEFIREYAIFFILPDLDLNQFCPPTDQIPILEPGTYTRFMAEGDTYLFDNRARLNAAIPNNGGRGASEYFTFTIQEAAGQNIKLTSPYCGNSSEEYKADDDSGLSGKLEILDLNLKIPPLPQRRLGFFTKLTATSGFGTISFTTPTAQDPPQ